MSVAASRSHAPSHPSHHSQHSHVSHHSERSHTSQREASHVSSRRDEPPPLVRSIASRGPPTVTPFDSISQVSSRHSTRAPPPAPTVESHASDDEEGSVAPADSISQVGSSRSHRSHASSHHSRASNHPSHASSARLTASNLHAHDIEPVIVVERAVESEHISRTGTERSAKTSQRGRTLEVDAEAEQFVLHGSHAGSHRSRSATPESRASTARPSRHSVAASHTGSRAQTAAVSEEIFEIHESAAPSHLGSRAPTAYSSRRSEVSPHSIPRAPTLLSSHSASRTRSEVSPHSIPRTPTLISSHSASRARSEISPHSVSRTPTVVTSHSASRALSEGSHHSAPRAPTAVLSHASSQHSSAAPSRTEEIAELEVESKHSSSHSPSPGGYHTLLVSPGSSPIRQVSTNRRKALELVHRHAPERGEFIFQDRSPAAKVVERAPAPRIALRAPSPRAFRGDFEPEDHVYRVEVERDAEQIDDRKYKIQRKHMYNCHEYY